ncbi:MAG: DUF1501 domain-containing protein [Planctomycetota bacterium]|nr:MAG: DUF1501 domain-containing protein [Planctomycetota bacterium]REK20422.1 MAG: DUF1501 domain-containing protein [Planctomycetota bacterium]REK29286.1 MAG: DUF1501 domain-containing protein [Planctomycetota bacterium]
MSSAAEFLIRRRLLQFAGGALGLNLGGLWRAQAEAAYGAESQPRASACILVFYYGGPSQLETYDMKPEAPAEVRGEFQPIATSAPGVLVSEHLPHMARVMHKVALIRSVTHQARLHDSASIHALTGRPLEGPDRELFSPLPQRYPSYGSAVTSLTQNRTADVPYAALPFVFRNVHPVPCQGGGFLGSRFDPLQIEVDPAERAYRAAALTRQPDLAATRTRNRETLLASLETSAATESTNLRSFYERAYRLLDSVTLHEALDISREPDAVRDRYGFGPEAVAVGEGGGGGNGAEMGYARHMRGQNLLLARRLVESGVPFVNVYDFFQQGQNWDAHFACANQHKQFLLPQADRALAALIGDLDERGLLDTTLVVAMGEFGRTPHINGQAGRDHWPDCYTVLMAGGGIQGGSVYGGSDRIAAYPDRNPVTPGDIAATIYDRFGLAPDTEIHDAAGRPHRLAPGGPIREIFSA